MKVFILCDYEGTSSTVSWEEETTLGPEAMAGDVNATIAGLRSGGFNEFVVRDYHGGGRTIRPADIDPEALLIRGKSTPFPYALDESFDAMVFIGAHSMAGTATGVMSHTMTGAVRELKINGKPVGEVGGYALLSGYIGIPLIMVAGDEAACKEAKDILDDVEIAPVKVGLTRFCGTCMHPDVARKLITEKAQAAANRLSEFKPLKWNGPFVLEVSFKDTEHADRSQVTLLGERVDDVTIRIKGDTVIDVLKAFEKGFE